MEVRQLPPTKRNWALKPFRMLLEHEIEYEVLLTKDLLQEPDWCEAVITVQKEFEDFDDGVIFDGGVTSVFRIKNKKREVDAEMLFGLLKIAGLNFGKAFAELVKGTPLEGMKISKPEFAVYEGYLDQVRKKSK